MCYESFLSAQNCGSLDGGMCVAVPRVRMSTKSSLSLGTKELCSASEERQSKDWRVHVLGEGTKYFLFLKHK